MPSDDETRLPSVAETLAPVLLRVPRERQPLLIAYAERLAAVRYRAWAADAADGSHRTALLACADREEEIARRVEGLYPDGAVLEREIVAGNPDLDEVNRSLFAGRPLEDQLTIQARGERLGAATWRSFARHAKEPEAGETFLSCARLEEESAVVLEAILGGRG